MKSADVPVAQYLRMSTEHQQYSLESQSASIDAYAREHAFEIVKTYSDAARSGVLFRGRRALQSLIEDVVRGTAAFKAILVYDVSRWGRFQDTDEAAHYEFLCKAAGIPIHYCAEAFTNDGGLPSLIMKSLKRVMAGEYSRELGVKVLAGQKRLAHCGFRQGGPPGYGLRRMLVSAEGRPKQRLANGERKSIASDRVVLTPGPLPEVRCVNRIYRMFINKGVTTYSEIARVLNSRGIPYVGGAEWGNRDVRVILTHPKYAGFNVYGRSTQRLYAPLVRIPKSEWILIPNAFPALVSQKTCAKAQRIVESKPREYTDEELLTNLQRVYARKGTLTVELIRKTKGCPSVRTSPTCSACSRSGDRCQRGSPMNRGICRQPSPMFEDSVAFRKPSRRLDILD
jgi:DNA invertase Pin-like site-specific DNA recombinase